MNWLLSFIVAIILLVLTVITSYILFKIKYRKERIFNSLNVLVCGVFLSAFVIYLPSCNEIVGGDTFSGAKTVLLSIFNALQLFILEGNFDLVKESTEHLDLWLKAAYTMYVSVLIVLAPVLSFGVVLSFFRNVFAYIEYWKHFWAEIFVFSELNEKSLALATNLKENNKKRVIIFTDVYEKNEESVHELIETARELGVIMFKKDITDIGFGFHCKRKAIQFFAIGENQVENMKQSLQLIEKYKERDNISLYVFATKKENELLLSTVDKGKIKVRRINEVRSLVSRHLYEEGIKIFESAIALNDKEKQISAVVLGMGERGIEMAKALPWFCQMDGYRAYIHLFDKEKDVKSRFCVQCPELMDENHNKKFDTKGEARYSIDVYDDIDVDTMEFREILKKIPRVTYVFVALGDDEINIRVAVELRSWFEREGMHPQIDALIRDSEKKKALTGITNHSKQAYNINFVGDIKASYSEKVILDSDVEEVALKRHMKWGKEEDFWKYEYNYRSSVASAIHHKMKVLCGIPGADQKPEERDEKDRLALRILEHRRWNAYMRTEGYSYGEERNNLAKTHHCLVEYEELSEEEQVKDDD